MLPQAVLMRPMYLRMGGDQGCAAQPALIAEVLHNPELDKVTRVYEAIRPVRARRRAVFPPLTSCSTYIFAPRTCFASAAQASMHHCILLCVQHLVETGIGTYRKQLAFSLPDT